MGISDHHATIYEFRVIWNEKLHLYDQIKFKDKMDIDLQIIGIKKVFFREPHIGAKCFPAFYPMYDKDDDKIIGT